VDEAVKRLSDDSGVLTRVLGLRHGTRYESLRLVFERGRLAIACDANTDEIILTADPASVDEDLANVADDPVLASLLGKVVELAWTLTNHRGYADGFQVRCLDLETRDESCCQFEVAAAAITVTLVG
jgi:hypothetical protein